MFVNQTESSVESVAACLLAHTPAFLLKKIRRWNLEVGRKFGESGAWRKLGDNRDKDDNGSMKYVSCVSAGLGENGISSCFLRYMHKKEQANSFFIKSSSFWWKTSITLKRSEPAFTFCTPKLLPIFTVCREKEKEGLPKTFLCK